MGISEKSESQADKFRDAVRKLETDQPEEAFDRIVKKVAKKKHNEAEDRHTKNDE